MAMFPKLLLERDVLFLVLTGFVCEGYLKVLKNVKRDIVATELVGGPAPFFLGDSSASRHSFTTTHSATS